MNGLRSRSSGSDLLEKGSEGGPDSSGGKEGCEELKECEEDLVVDVDRELGTPPRKKGSMESDDSGKEKGLSVSVSVSVKKKDGRGRPRKNVGNGDGKSDKNLLVSVKKKDGRGRPRKNEGSRDGESDKNLLVSVKKKDGRGRPRKNEESRDGEPEKNLLVSVRKKDGRGRPRKKEESRDGESDKNLLVSVRKKDGRGRPRKNEGSRDGESDKNLLVSVERKRGRPMKGDVNKDGECDENLLGSVPRKLGRPRKNEGNGEGESDKDLSVPVQRKLGRPRKIQESKAGRPRKNDGGSDSDVVEKSIIGSTKRKRKPNVEKIENKRARSASNDMASDTDLLVSVQRKIGRPRKDTGSSDSFAGEKSSVDSQMHKGELEQTHSVVALTQKSKLQSKKHMIRKGETYDALVPVDTKNSERPGKASDQSKEDEKTSSPSADRRIGKRTRSSGKPKNDIESSQSPPISEEKTSAKRNKHHRLRKNKNDTSLQLGLEAFRPSISEKKGRNKGGTTLAADLRLETEFPKERKRSELKQSVSDKIKSMVENAGWKIEYRLRASRNYRDAVYVDHAGGTYWSVLKAYYALQNQYGNNESDQKHRETGFLFTPIPEELLGILKRQTEKGKKKRKSGTESAADKEPAKKRKCDNMKREKLNGVIRNKGKSLKMRLATKRFKVDKNIGHRRPNSHKAGNNRKNPMPKTAEAKNALFPTKSQLQARKSKTRRGYTLLVRTSGQEVNSSGDNFIAYAGRRTILSWLIDSEIVSLGEKVKYMNKTHSQALLEGFITRDGINCGCCSEIVTIQEFEAHAGSKFCQPCQNIFVETGISLFQCQIDAWNKQEESERSGYHCIDIRSDDPNDDTCGICGDGGDLICCDGCPSTFHQSCLGIQVLPKGDWHCFNCCCKFCGVVGSGAQEDDVTTSSLLTCSLCEQKYHGLCILQTNGVSVASGVLSTFCGQNCRELSEKLQKLIGVRHELEAGFSWTVIQRCDLESEKSLCELSQKVECNSKSALALSIMDECFLPTIDERSGINLIHNVVYNCGSNFNRLNYGGFYTFLLERGDEIISAASIRIHGTRFAEMPFIGTRYMYRRQGMCRRLLNAIDLSLSHLNVEKLIIPAISELLDTWTKVFGFVPLEETFKHELKSLNMLVFPGVALLQKLPSKHNLAETMFTESSAVNATGLESDNHIATDEKDGVAGGVDLGSPERAVEAKSPSLDESSTYSAETNTLLKNSNVESSHDFIEDSVNDGETKCSARNTIDVLNASLTSVSESVCFGSNSKFNSDSTKYIELESKPLEVSPEELHATHCEESTHDAFDVNVQGDATLVHNTAMTVKCHDSVDNLEDGLEGQAFELLRKTDSDSNASGAEDSFFDAADSFHVVGNKVPVTESKSKSMDSDSVGCTKMADESLNAVTNGDCVAYVKSNGHDSLRNSCKSSSEVLNAADLGKESMHNVGDESLAVLSGGSDLKDFPHIVAESISQVSSGICCTPEHLLSAPGYTCDTAANDTSTESNCIRNHSVVLNLQESGEQDSDNISQLQRSS